MIYALIALVAALATSTFIYRRKYMDYATINSKLAAASAAVDAKLASDAAEISALKTNQNDPAALLVIADGLDAIIAKVLP